MSESDPDYHNAIGRWMIYAAWILFLALLTVYFNNYMEYQYNPNKKLDGSRNPDGSDQVNLTRNRYGHYVASGLINHQPVTFLLDTGATHISIPERVARRLGLERSAPQSVVTANGRISVYGTRLDSVSIGPVEIRGLRGGINPHMDGDEVLLGMNFLKHLDIIQRGDQMILRRPSGKSM